VQLLPLDAMNYVHAEAGVSIKSVACEPSRTIVRKRAKHESELQSDLRTSLSRLSADKRTVLVLAEVEGFSGEEIAQMLGIPVGTVWTRLHYARRQLRSLQEDES